VLFFSKRPWSRVMGSIKSDYDVVVIGSGVAGSTTALCLSKSGVKTLVIDHKQHPRFTIGESTVPTTSLNFNHLGETYKIPELFGLSIYHNIAPRKTVTAYSKSGFWFGFHEEGKESIKTSDLFFETFPAPNGPDTHLLRSELDHYLTSLYPKYKVDFLDNTSIQKFEYNADGNVEFELESKGKKKVVDLAKSILEDSNVEHAADDKDNMVQGGRPIGDDSFSSPPVTRIVRAKFVVDASGHAAYLGRKFGLKQKDAQLNNRTRTIYGHFEWPKDRQLILERDDLYGPCPFRNYREAGTMHHVFHGGWIWVIPFDNDTVSIGIVLNVDKYPYPKDMTKEEEYEHILRKFPTVWKQIGGLRPLTPLIRSSRMQLFSDTMLGDRFILTPHASAFIDPLFSTGILMTTRFVIRFVPRMVKALKENDFSKARFEPMQVQFFREAKFIDRLVSGMIASFSSYEIFKQYWMIWIEGSQRQSLEALCHSKCNMPLYGSHDPKWYKACKQAWKMVMEYDKNKATMDDKVVAAKVAEVVKPHMDLLDMVGLKAEVGVTKPIDIRVYAKTPYEVKLLKHKNPKYLLLFLFTICMLIVNYCVSKLFGTPYHKAIDHIHYERRLPGHQSAWRFFDAVGKAKQPNRYIFRNEWNPKFDY
jgi:FADH2 O2-dependent halogenase